MTDTSAATLERAVRLAVSANSDHIAARPRLASPAVARLAVGVLAVILLGQATLVT